MFKRSDGSFLQSRQRFSRNEQFEEELNNLFNKKYHFRFNSEWKLPERESWFTTPPWKAKQLDILKSRLNFHKSQLNDFNIEEWSTHTRRRNPAGEVCWKIRCLVNPEFLTQAWTKFYECAYTYNIIPQEAVASRKMVSLHLCEAPGAFITSLNHYLKQNHPGIEWKWVANTLNPYYEGNSSSNMISDDRFMFHTLDNWHFGLDNTGNLMDWDNSQAIIARAKTLGKVMLVTADGSIDCLQKPDAQEEVTSPLHYCEIITALQTLSPGGTFIFKLFTMFEHSTVSLLYLLNHLFKEVNIYKPVTSRQGNSEVYAICLKYNGSSVLQEHIPILKSTYGSDIYSNLALFPLEAIPDSFLSQIEHCAMYFSSVQSQVINNNLQAYLMQNNIALHTDMKKIRSIVAAEFIWQYDLKPLLYEHEILKGILHEENKININPRYDRGSYTERQLYSKMSMRQKLQNLNAFLQTAVLSNPLIFINEQVQWLENHENHDGAELKLRFTFGRPLEKINSSKFIFVPIFRLYQQILAEEEFKEIFQHQTLSLNPKDLSDVIPQPNKSLSLPVIDYEENYALHEKSCFRLLLETLKGLSVGDSLLLNNFNALTHFNVGILYILSRNCFQKTAFTSSCSIILSKFTSKESLKYFYDIDKECDSIKDDLNKDVLNSLPVQITNVGEFFNNIVFYNNTFYRNKCSQYLSIVADALG